MDIFFTLVSFFLIFYLWKENKKLNSKLIDLSLRLSTLEKQTITKNPESQIPEVPPIIEPISKPVQEKNNPFKAPEGITKEYKIPSKVQDIPVEKPIPAWREKLDSLRIQILENWTGLAGTLVLVLGTGFLGLYAAFVLSALFRVLMILSFSVLIYFLSGIVKKRFHQENLSDWLESASVTIALFTAMGSGFVDGLKFLEGSFAYFPLFPALILNFYVGYRKEQASRAVFHLLLSLLVLSLLPPSQTMLGLGTCITFLVQWINYRKKWDFHLLATGSAYFLFHIYQYDSIGEIKPYLMNALGISFSFLIYTQAILVPYFSKEYRTSNSNKIAILTHSLSWIFLGILLGQYSIGEKYISFLILFFSFVLYFFSHSAKTLNIYWLFLSDRIVSIALFVLATANFLDFGLSPSLILFLSSLGIFALLLDSKNEKDKVLISISYSLLFLYSLVHIGLILNTIDNSNKPLFDSENFYSMIFFPIVFAIHRIHKFSNYIPYYNIFRISTNSIYLIGFLVTYLYYLSHLYSEILIGVQFLFLFWLIRLYRNRSFYSLIHFYFLTILCINWFQIQKLMIPGDLDKFLFTTLPLIIISFMSIFFLKSPVLKFSPGIYFSSISILGFVYYLTLPYSTLLPGVLILSITPLISAASIRFLEYRKDLLISGFLFLLFFILRHIVVHLQAEFNFFFLPVRFWIESYSITIFLYYYLEKNGYEYFHGIKKYFLEVILLFSFFLMNSILPDIYFSLFLSLEATLLLYLSGMKFDETRMKIYSRGVYLGSAFTLAILTGSGDNPPSNHFWMNLGFSGILSIFSMIVYIVFQFKKGILGESEILQVRNFANPGYALNFYPFLISVILFLSWSFSGGSLTFFWTLLGVGVFLIGIYLKEKHFTYSSTVLFVFCLIKLFFIDMSDAGTIQKAFVFMGMGVLLILTNFLYAKFRDRL
ncbi:MAG: hypothetical protein H7A24_13215 [Leptospiraceae bacterium]|nr:hypothetical protein [Leptospiraceae bacterium]MCP5512837.1 hypothetical protein [Leptospiraceae bacterium]